MRPRMLLFPPTIVGKRRRVSFSGSEEEELSEDLPPLKVAKSPHMITFKQQLTLTAYQIDHLVANTALSHGSPSMCWSDCSKIGSSRHVMVSILVVIQYKCCTRYH